jgi:hypothetical protein
MDYAFAVIDKKLQPIFLNTQLIDDLSPDQNITKVDPQTGPCSLAMIVE